MTVATISMPRDEAIRAYRDYRKAVRENPNSVDRAIMLGYRALAKGKAVIDLVQAMRVAGVHPNGLPKLAVARANWKEVRFLTSTWRKRRWEFTSMESDRACITIPSIDLDRRAEQATTNNRALVPYIPPMLRPAEAQLKNYCILWEADWQLPPGDPLLIKHLAGTLYAVLAVWDLTPLEQTVMGSRIGQ